MAGGQDVAAVVVCHDSAADAPRTLAALAAQLRPGDELIVVDNGSRDGTPDVVRGAVPSARVIETGANLGFAGGCVAGARTSDAALLLFVNPDAVPGPGFVDALRAVAGSEPRWGAWQALVTLEDEALVNTAGNIAHWLGVGWAGLCDAPVGDAPAVRAEVGYPSGAALMVRGEAWRTLGGFDARYFMYGEDQDLGLRLRLAGWGVGVEPAARIAHDYVFTKGDYKWFHLERNRWWTVLSDYPGALLVLVLPALLGFELALLAVAARGGWLRAKLRSQAAVLRELPLILRRRREVQATRTVSARRFADGLSASLDSPYLEGAAALPLLPALQRAYWRAVRALLALGGVSGALHVGLDLLFLVPGQTGGRETYVRELLPALRAAEPGLRVTAFVGREAAQAGEGFWTRGADRVVALPRVAERSRVRWALGESLVLPRAADRAGVDVLHCPANFAPSHGRCARVLTLHDLLWRRLPDAVSPAMRLGTGALVPRGARRAHRVLTGSHATKADAVAELGLDPARVDVVPYGLGATPAPGDAGRGRALLGVPAGRAVVLGVATDLPHKNLDALVEALALIDGPARPLLALAGHGTDGGRLAGLASARGVSEDVRALGAISAADLEDLYAAATALATPTRFEGFGLPVLEAMARGVPVACSDLPVLREVAGEAAVWLDPGDPRQIARALTELLGDSALRERLVDAGRERVRAFTWEATARGTLAAYAEAIQAAGASR